MKPPPDPRAEEFAAVYERLRDHVQSAAAERGEPRIGMPHPSLASTPDWEVPAAALMELPDSEFVDDAYLLILDQPPSLAERQAWETLLTQELVDREAMIGLLVGSPQYAESGRRVILER